MSTPQPFTTLPAMALLSPRPKTTPQPPQSLHAPSKKDNQLPPPTPPTRTSEAATLVSMSAKGAHSASNASSAGRFGRWIGCVVMGCDALFILLMICGRYGYSLRARRRTRGGALLGSPQPQRRSILIEHSTWRKYGRVLKPRLVLLMEG